jgi:hypothetical protein
VTGPEFYPGAIYRINVDTGGDNQADVAFSLVFSQYEDGRPTGTAWYATGAQARQAEPGGEVRAPDHQPVHQPRRREERRLRLAGRGAAAAWGAGWLRRLAKLGEVRLRKILRTAEV